MTPHDDPESRARVPLRRAAIVRIYDHHDRLVLLAPDGRAHELTGDSAELAREVLALLGRPHTAEAVLRHVESLAGGPLPRPEVIDELLQLLLHLRAIEPARPDPPPRGPGPRVLLGLTGAVATMHAPALIQRLQARGCEVRVAATADALKFIRPEAIEALTHRPVVAGLWPEGDAHRVPHLELAQWADLVLVAPASATTIARLATGDHGSIVAAIALATRAPVVVAPSMNPAMFASPAVQRNLATLTADGMHIVHPARALEVAERPDDRVPLLGGAPPPEVLLAIVEAVLRARTSERPRGADGWDRLYRTHPPDDLPWQRDTADDDLLATLTSFTPTATTILEIGAGLGALAVAVAARGHHVVATDISTAALEHARARAPEAPVVWLQDDITATHLRGHFKIIIDRACLHVLDNDEAARYAAAVTHLLPPGGRLLLKILTDAARGVRPYTADDLRALFKSDLELERDDPAALPGPREAPPARLFVLRRR